MSQNIVYKTFEINTNIEHDAKPINLSGATTIRLTNIPSNVKCWISTESNGTNLYPLINRGDGWVNLPFPLYNLYVYTQGITPDNQKIILNFTGQNDFFVYGNNSSERVDKVGLIEGFSPRALMDLNNAIYNLYNKPKLIKTISIQGEYGLQGTAQGFNKIVLPLDGGINSLNLQDDKFYKLEFFGHIDNGAGSDYEGNSGSGCAIIASHFCLFKNTNGATFVPDLTQDIDNLYTIDKQPWLSEKTDLFDIFGLKYSQYRYVYSQGVDNRELQDKGLNFLNNAIFDGTTIKQYDNVGLHMRGWVGVGGTSAVNSVYMHSSLLIHLYEMQDPTQSNLIGV